MKKAIIAALAMVAMVGCAKDQNFDGSTTTTAQEIKITSGIESRTDGNAWVAGDKIAICAFFPNAYMLTGDIYYPLSSYSAASSGASTTFTVDPDYSYLPVTSEASQYEPLAICGFYPASIASADDENIYQCQLDITDQSDFSAIDALQATAEITDVAVTQVELSFEHIMAMATFNIEAETSVGSLEDMRFEIVNIATVSDPTMVLDSSSTDDVQYGTIEGFATVADDGCSATVTMILFSTACIVYPDNGGYTDATINLYAGDKMYTTPFVTALYQGYNNTFNLSLGTGAITFDGSTILPWDDSEDDPTDLPTTKLDNYLTAESFMALTEDTLPTSSDSWYISGEITFSASSFGSMLSGIDAALGSRSISLTFLDATNIDFMATESNSGGINPTARFIDNISEVYAPQATTLQEYHFYGCNTLNVISLPKVEAVVSCAFGSCLSLHTLILPSVTAIEGYDCFGSLGFLCSVDIYMTSPNPITLEEKVFYSFTSYSKNCRLYLHYNNSALATDEAAFGMTTWSEIVFVDDLGQIVDASGEPLLN